MLGEPERNDADVEDPRPRVSPPERLAQHFPIVLVGHENDLRVEFDAGGEQTVEYLDAMGGVLADDAAADLGVRGVQRHAQRADMLLDDARLVFGGEVREGDERAREEAQTEVVVAQREGRPHVIGELAHEAEDAGVAALLHAVEHHAGKFEAPIFTFAAFKLHFASFAVGVDVAERDEIVGGKPAPVDHVAHGLTVHAGDDAAWRESGVVGGAFGQHVLDDGARRLGRTTTATLLRRLNRHVLGRIHAHASTAVPSKNGTKGLSLCPIRNLLSRT